MLSALIILLFFATNAYAATAGKKLWVKRYTSSGQKNDIPRDATVGPRNVLYVAGSSANKLALIKYAVSGRVKWKRFYKPKGYGSAQGTQAAVDPLGNVYVLGVAFSASSGRDYILIKYSAGGRKKWAKRVSANVLDEDAQPALAVGTNSYLLGVRKKRTGSREHIIVKHDSRGRRKWTRRIGHDGSSDFFERSGSIGVDQNENAYAAIYKGGNYVTVKYGSGGRRKWVRRYDGPGNGDDEPSDLLVDKGGNVYVTGASQGPSGDRFSFGFATIKYDSGGNLLWVRRYKDAARDMSMASKLALDRNGNLFVGGANWAFDAVFWENIIIKYNKGGDKVWLRRNRKILSLKDLATDNAGDVIVSGDGFSTSTERSFSATTKYSSSGKRLWTRTYRDRSFRTNAMAASPKGTVFVTGPDRRNKLDFATIRYAP